MYGVIIMEKITNNILNNTNKNVLKDKVDISTFDKSASFVTASNNEKVVDLKDAKLLSSNLAKSAPIDSDKVAKLKAAISAGNYPLDLDKVSDALMQAYRDMKS
jgi:negative regulator of flagellin synthesis FlgM